MSFETFQTWRVGHLVRYHDTNSKKRTSGIVIEAKEAVVFGGGWSYTVLWNEGLVSPHSGWELFKLEDKCC